MKTQASFFIPLAAPFNYLTLAAISTIRFLLTDLSTDFSRHVYTSNLFDPEKLKLLKEKIEQKGTGDFTASEEELLQIYSSHYMANLFGADKNAFFKWYLEFEQGDVKDSEDFRKVMMNTHKAALIIIENTYGENTFLIKQKKKLEEVFGSIREEK